MKKILVIEDNDNNMYLIRYILQAKGYEIIEARCGLEGVETALEIKPDLILMDIQLPDINGLEATRRIRGDKGVNTVPIVAITSYAMTGDRDKALEAGCSGYIEKPINPETFLQEIETYI